MVVATLFTTCDIFLRETETKNPESSLTCMLNIPRLGVRPKASLPHAPRLPFLPSTFSPRPLSLCSTALSLIALVHFMIPISEHHMYKSQTMKPHLRFRRTAEGTNKHRHIHFDTHAFLRLGIHRLCSSS